jgi:mevalonate pyrophosphate decarboxylase
MEVDMEPQQVAKRQKNASGSSSRVRFDGVELADKSSNTPKATRRSARSSKANSKKDVGELFSQLAREYQAISKTCEEIADAV